MTVPLTRLATRVLGLCVAATIALVATQFLALGFQTEPLVDAAGVDRIDRWLRRPPVAGAGVLGGGLLLAVAALGLVGLVWPDRGPAAITTRRDGGWTRIDRRSLGAAIARSLSTGPRDREVTVRVSRRRTIDVDVTGAWSGDSPAGTLRDVTDDLVALCSNRHLPVEAGTVTMHDGPPGRRGRVR